MIAIKVQSSVVNLETKKSLSPFSELKKLLGHLKTQLDPINSGSDNKNALVCYFRGHYYILNLSFLPTMLLWTNITSNTIYNTWTFHLEIINNICQELVNSYWLAIHNKSTYWHIAFFFPSKRTIQLLYQNQFFLLILQARKILAVQVFGCFGFKVRIK